MDVPTFQINNNDLQNLSNFISKHESILKEFGGIKIQLNINCKLALKKRPKNLVLPPIMEQIRKIADNELIYFTEKFDKIDKSIEEDSLIIDESTFWSSLSSLKNKGQQLNSSLVADKSFFLSKTSRTYFDIHRLPDQSFLKIGGKKITRQFVPWVKRAHQSGSIFPMTCTKQGLFSIDYHHEGGIHYWYIIPNYQRNNFEQLIKQKNSSICLDHGQLIIDPSILDKNNIRYHKIIQHPNEFVVLSPGTLSQSFTLDASWSEAINFALPSWIKDNHADLLLPSCHCNIQNKFLPKLIDLTSFRNELIHLNLDINSNQNTKDLNSINMETTNYIQNNSSNNEDLMKEAEPIISCFSPPSISMITASGFCYSCDENTNKVDVQYQVFEEDSFWDPSDASLLEFLSSECLLESNAKASQFHQTPNPPIQIHGNPTWNLNMDSNFLSYEELMTFSPFNGNNIVPISQQDNQNIGVNGSSTISSNKHTTWVNKQNHVVKEGSLHRTTDNDKTLFVSGLKINVNKNDIRKHFSGCTQVTIKQCRGTSHLKYAFVVHRTSREAERNLQRPIDYYLLGPECHVEYANASSGVSSKHNSLDNKKLLVSQISENVSENDLKCLFINAHILKYNPARSIQLSTMEPETNMKKNKILTGYAVLLYDNEEQAANVIEHAEQYQTNGQSLVISVYRNEKPSHATTR